MIAASGAQSKEETKVIVETAAQQGITFSDSTETPIDVSKYMPRLAALANRTT
jgi:hypothetical protein